MPDQPDLLTVPLPPLARYLFLTFVLSVVIRTVLALFYALERHIKGTPPTFKWRQWCVSSPFWSAFLLSLTGTRQDEADTEGKPALEGGDYLVPLLLGWLELSAYALLIATERWEIIGAWFTLKTVAQYRSWAESRATFNRFLLGNALVLTLAYAIARSCLPK